MKTKANGNLFDYDFFTLNNDIKPCESDNLTIPLALVDYYNKLLYSSYLFLEVQLSKVDGDSETYERLNTLTQRIFESWITLGYREGGESNSDSF